MVTIAALAAAILTPDGFKAWLETQPKDKAIGRQRLMNKCPVQRYLVDMGFKHVEVGNVFDMGTITLYADAERTKQVGYLYTPEWVQHFASLVDDSSAPEEEHKMKRGWDSDDDYDKVERYYERIRGAFKVPVWVAAEALATVLKSADL